MTRRQTYILLLIVLALLACCAVCLCASVYGWVLIPRIMGPTPTLTSISPFIPSQTPYAILPRVDTPGSENTLTPSLSDPLLFGASGIGDPYFPDMGNSGYDVLHYDLHVTVDMEGEKIQAKAAIQAVATENLGRFNLDLWGLTVDAVSVDGESAAFDHQEGELIITPPSGLPEGKSFTVDVEYGGEPGKDPPSASIKFLEGWTFYDGGVLVAGEPTGAETWFPVNNHPLDKATYTISITVAKPYVVASNGVQQEVMENDDGTRTFVWEMDDPMASYLATVAISNFEIVEGRTSSGIPVRSYLDTDIRAEVEEPVRRIPEILDFYESTFGPYPFATCGVVVHEKELGFALEDQTLVVMGYTFADEMTIVHELAHQWFGDSVSLARWQDIWLNEGFASYAEVLWIEREEGPQAGREDITARYDAMSFGPQDVLIGDPGPDDLFDWAVYDRGALTLYALRLKIGDADFFSLLRTYYARYAGGNARTEDFIAVAEEISGQELDDFFRIWLYEYELPDIPEGNLFNNNS